jgi:hypothetical protein
MNIEGGGARSVVTALVSGAAPAAMCTILLDGRYWTAGELGRCAGVMTSAAREQLSRLAAAGVLESVAQGPHSYFRITDAEVAAAIRTLPRRRPAAARPPRQGNAAASLPMRAARTCYGHLAGQLGVRVTDLLISNGVVTAELGPGDLAPLASLDLYWPVGSARAVVRPCVDWTERRPHAAGLLPAALTVRLLELGWLRRTPPGRAVRLTDAGRAGLSDLLPARARRVVPTGARRPRAPGPALTACGDGLAGCGAEITLGSLL